MPTPVVSGAPPAASLSRVCATIGKLARRWSHLNWALADQGLVSGCNFATGVLVARNLGVAEFGRFTLVWMVVLFVASLAHAAINAPMMSVGPKQAPADAASFYGAVVVHQGVFAALSFLVIYAGTISAAVWFPAWQTKGLALPLATATALWQTQDFVRRYFFTRGHAAKALINDTISYGGQLAILLCLSYFGSLVDVSTVVWVMAATCGLAIAHGAVAMESVAWSRGAVIIVTVRHWHVAQWLIATAVLVWMSGNLFFIVAGTVLGATAVGALRAAQNLVGITHILFQGLENVAPMAAARTLARGGPQAMVWYLRRVAGWGGLVTLIIILPIVLAPQFWMTLVLGIGYADQAYLLLWFGALYLLVFSTISLRLALRTLEYTRPIFVSYVSASAVSLLGAYPLAHSHGLTGLMACWLTSQGVLQLVLWRGFAHYAKLRF